MHRHSLVLILLIGFAQSQQLPIAAPPSSSLMGLLSTQDIAELTQMATEIAAQTMQSNGQLIANSGPEVKPIPMDARPSEMLGQGLTNMLQPARQLAALNLNPRAKAESAERVLLEDKSAVPETTSLNKDGAALLDLANKFLGGGSRNNYDVAESRGSGLDGQGMIGQAMRMFTGGNGETGSAGRSLTESRQPLPTLRQLLPGADKNFGFKQGEGCLPFLGEFMKMAYGNCVKRADEKTWDAWGKEINNALTGGKIDLLRASKETCRMGAEREQCNQLRRAISGCDIIASIQLASNLQRSVTRCDEITGLMDQNPGTILNQMNGLINGEVAQGFLNNFLGGGG